MLPSADKLFYDTTQQPVMVLGQTSDGARASRRGHLSRQDSRNFRSSRSPPPSRSNDHTASWYGYRNSSQSPPRSRSYSEHTDYGRHGRHGRSPERSKRSWFGLGSRKESQSPPTLSYHERQSHTKYKEDYTGYPQETGYDAENGYAAGTGYRTHHGYSSRESHSAHGGRSSRDGYSDRMYSSSVPYASSDMYHGQNPATTPRTYVTPYGATNFYKNEHVETVKLKVPICCEGCEERITSHMLGLEGVQSVHCDQRKEKVTVIGTASPADVLRQGRECFKQSRFW